MYNTLKSSVIKKYISKERFTYAVELTLETSDASLSDSDCILLTFFLRLRFNGVASLSDPSDVLPSALFPLLCMSLSSSDVLDSFNFLRLRLLNKL